MAAAQPLLDELWATTLDLGRRPEADEVTNLAVIDADLGGLPKAFRLIARHYDHTMLEAAAVARADDVRLLMATQQFAKRSIYRHLEQRLQRDIKAFFGDYRSAQAAGLQLLLDAADPKKILAACRLAATQGLGWLDAEHSLQLHISLVERLPALLRAYVTCGLIIWDALSDVQLVKIHIASGKLTLMEFEAFDEHPLPRLRRRIKVMVRKLDCDVFDYGSPAYPMPLLYRKSRYVNEDHPGYAEQLAFDEALERSGVLDDSEFGPAADTLTRLLDAKRLAIEGMRLGRSTSIPDLDTRCGASLTYRTLIQCGETGVISVFWESSTKLQNDPKSVRRVQLPPVTAQVNRRRHRGALRFTADHLIKRTRRAPAAECPYSGSQSSLWRRDGELSVQVPRQATASLKDDGGRSDRALQAQ